MTMKQLLFLITMLLLQSCTTTGQTLPQETITTRNSAYSMDETLTRLRTAMQNMGINLVAEVDHAKAAAGKDLDLRPTHVLIFGNPLVGTNLMQADQRAGLDLPLRLLVWEDAQGQVYLSYRSPQQLQQDFRLQDQKAVLDKMEKVFEKMGEVVRE
jgi:uncharacterized protein (DUF302 family)